MNNEKNDFTKIGSLELMQLVEKSLDVMAPYIATGIESGKFMMDVGSKRALDIGGLIKELITYAVERDAEGEEFLLNSIALLVTSNLHHMAGRMKNPPDIMVGGDMRDELFGNSMN